MKIDSGIFARAKSEPKTIHVRERARDAWCLTLDDEARPISIHPTRGDALALAHALARRGAAVVDHELARAAG